jgi:Ras-related protein Rab-11A
MSSMRRRRRSRQSKGQDGQEKRKTDFFMKLVLAGDGAVGKTALRERFLGKGFSSSYLMTIGADFASKDALLPNGKLVKYQIWDLAGQQEFEGVRSTYYEGCSGSLMVFDLTRPLSFENIPKWIAELWKNSGKGPVPIILLGNKYDLVEQVPNPVTQEAVDQLLDQLNAKTAKYGFSVPYFHTSALTGLNVEEAFAKLGEQVVSWITKLQEK